MTRTTKSLHRCFTTLVATAFVAAVSISGIAQAGNPLLWYDGFVIDDNPAAPASAYQSGFLATQEGGEGTFFTGAWEPVNPADLGADGTVLAQSSLTSAGQHIPSIGGRAGDEPVTAFDQCCDTSRTAREFAQPFSGIDGTIYMGFLVNFGVGSPTDPHYRSVEFWNGGFANNWLEADDPMTPEVEMGRSFDNYLNMALGFSSFGNFNDPINDTDGPGGTTDNRQLSLSVDGVREMFGSDVNTHHQLEEHLEWADQIGTTHSIVLKFDLSTNDAETGGTGDTISVFLNPKLTDTTEPAPSLVVGSVDLNLDAMSSIVEFNFTGGSPLDGAGFDELRVGNTWESVAIRTPEPGTAMLLGLGLMGVLASAGRKRN